MNRVDGAAESYVVGVDYGTLSGRALVVRVGDGAEVGTAVHEYGDGVISAALPNGRSLPPDWALQNPQDYRDVLRHAVPAAVSAAGIDPAAVIGIGIDFTACTVLPTFADGTPLCEDPDLRDRPHAWVKLWKHHAAQPHADRINALAHERAEPWIGRYGGKISAEWQFAKGLQILEEDPEVYHRAERFIEAADWIVWQLCGAETRNVCTAGYKGILQDGQYPSEGFLTALNPGFGDFVTKLDGPLLPLGAKAGTLTATAAAWTGLPEGIAVAVATSTRTSQRPRRRPWSPVGSSPSWAPPPATWSTVGNPPRWPACAGWSTAASAPAHGATRPGRAVSATSSAGSSSTPPRPGPPRTSTSPHWPPANRSARTALSRWTGGTATARCLSTTT